MTPHDEPRRPSDAPALARVFVGREEELAVLRAALARAMAGRGTVVLVSGEPGIGKTELADRLAAAAESRGVHVVWGRAWEGEGAPAFWSWARIIGACLAQWEREALATRLGAALPYLAQVAPEAGKQLPGLPTPPSLDSEQARFRLFDAVTTFLTVSSREQPLVVVLDDLHWADKPSLLMLQFLAREIADSRLLVIGTYRDVEVSRGNPLADVLPALRRERTVARILLRGLPEEDVRTLVAALEGDKVPAALGVRSLARPRATRSSCRRSCASSPTRAFSSAAGRNSRVRCASRPCAFPRACGR